MAKIVIVTGGIGSGKSTVVKRFGELGVPCINADDIVHDAYNDASIPSCQMVKAIFGDDLEVDRKIDRIALRERLTTDKDYEVLGDIWSGYVLHTLHQFADTHRQEPYVVWEVPLAIESGWTAHYTIAVVAPEETRIQRVIARSKLTYEQVMLRINCQAKLPEIVAKADFVLPNNSDLTSLIERVDILQLGLYQWINI